ncbi:Cyanophycin synthetase [Pirellulimonas nuda]|uniref:Cyanophycin synthetase n=1 Tax=Pirellulimonas nuda TaxID=2528009 RepID=A0A518DCF5_9BACT|nr:N-acetylglutaminylglutamine synthetase [Pirellulimonas nuda]QDU89167.1 Cyanophycin synthetase [Pirellulimonas nuda]
MSQTIPPGAVALDVGWGRLLFAHTFPDPASLAEALLQEESEKRDIAFYAIDPQIVLNLAPQDLFLDPSDTYRLDLESKNPGPAEGSPLRITGVESREDIDAINSIYLSVGMVPLDPESVWHSRGDKRFEYLVVRPPESDADRGDSIIGVALAVDHARCFDDLMNSSSLWALAVDPQSRYPGVGAALVRHIADRFAGRGRAALDLSVLHENSAAIALYKGLGFERVPVLAIKRRNHINEPLFIPNHSQDGFNPYATIIINEALRRNIAVEPLDPARGYFRLSLGNRRVTCRESLTDLTSAIAMTRCADKQLTRELVDAAGLRTPAQAPFTSKRDALEFLERHGRVVVKPADGEQGQGVFVDIRGPRDLIQAIDGAGRYGDRVLLEEYVEGQDLRVIVINYEVVAAAVRKPAEIIGTGRHSVGELLDRVSRRRRAATAGESSIPDDEETDRCIAAAGLTRESVLPEGQELQVRKTANLHTGGTIHDATDRLSDTLASAAITAARVLETPVVGLDMLVPDVSGDEYVIIEANERPGLANHEPQPTAERFIDLLFPHAPKPVEAKA